MQIPSKISGTSASNMPPALYGLQGWADLPEGLLHSIVPLLNSFLELLAFAGTCRSWRAAFASYPSKSTFCTLLPPLLVQPFTNLLLCNDDDHDPCKCELLDPTNLKSTLRCQIPVEAWDLCFAGSSYGQLICGGGRKCLVADLFTGAQVLPPQLPFDDDTFLYSGLLTAPLSSNEPHLLVCAASNLYSTQYSLLDWPVGSNSWSELWLGDSLIVQIVEFNGQFFALDCRYNLYTLSLAPQLGLQEIATVLGDDMASYIRPCLVVCGDMLLMVDHRLTFEYMGAPVECNAYRLDMSTVPAVWVEVKKLENYSLFIGCDKRSPPFSCASPGRWGGRSNCLYYWHYFQSWVLHGIGDDAAAVCYPENDPDLVLKRKWYFGLHPFWVYPSMFYR